VACFRDSPTELLESCPEELAWLESTTSILPQNEKLLVFTAALFLLDLLVWQEQDSAMIELTDCLSGVVTKDSSNT
jgi:hypothetical protein